MSGYIRVGWLRVLVRMEGRGGGIEFLACTLTFMMIFVVNM